MNLKHLNNCYGCGSVIHFSLYFSAIRSELHTIYLAIEIAVYENRGKMRFTNFVRNQSTINSSFTSKYRKK